ncbi:hypothetical protein Hanom_Chr12g01095551 [Helianthus anomalus]
MMQNYYRAGGLTGSSLSILTGSGKAVYTLRSSNPTFVLLSVGFTDYDDDELSFFSNKFMNIILYSRDEI